jgi:hypothetical protein
MTNQNLKQASIEILYTEENNNKTHGVFVRQDTNLGFTIRSTKWKNNILNEISPKNEFYSNQKDQQGFSTHFAIFSPKVHTSSSANFLDIGDIDHYNNFIFTDGNIKSIDSLNCIFHHSITLPPVKFNYVTFNTCNNTPKAIHTKNYINEFIYDVIMFRDNIFKFIYGAFESYDSIFHFVNQFTYNIFESMDNNFRPRDVASDKYLTEIYDISQFKNNKFQIKDIKSDKYLTEVCNQKFYNPELIENYPNSNYCVAKFLSQDEITNIVGENSANTYFSIEAI